jgi:inorganic pyrophosphatase
LSTIIPVICLCFTGYQSSSLLGYYGVALAAIGMLANLPICLAIDGYGPISDNAGGIA